MIRIAIPNKGRLHDPTVELLKEAGLPVLEGGTRKLFAKTNDPEITILFARASDIPEYVQDGAADVGVTGLDLISETGAQVEMLLDMGFGRASLVLAVPEESHLNTPQSLEGKRIATEFPNITSRYFKNLGVNVEIVKVSGACELTPHVGIADAIVDISSSGTTLATNHLKMIENVFSSSVYLIANKKTSANNSKIEQISTSIESVIRAKGKRYLMMNVPESSLEAVKQVLPGLAGPTVMKVEASQSILAVHAVIDADLIFSTVNKLKSVGAKDVLVIPIERLMP
ncbi:ATP phosphoribosyltransferase [Methanomethylovorans hollandica DSM 15978]|uniref:ATP phosphoribosyltransferase n=1 Tax=Methanomethylovorans hollandica (strain DSM 15978 / NBRC 107637 / DMS1) TaxID=867904 RepID=L0KSJ8_METHD|nr:ATP phosphoribosyltransferase [Methanomethylovorans hollandica]AGB48387.1 ATP phosphoribosyltransferase [Methanomethylovorans hollandica DSM 15978]